VVAVVSAHDEADRIAATVASLRRVVEQVLVIDDGSGDETARLAEAAGARVLRTGRDIGKGAALEKGLDLLGGEVSAWLLADGDLGDTAAGLGLLLGPVLEGRADLAIAVLPRQASGGFGLVKRFAGWCIARLSGYGASEPLSGQRAVSAEALSACRPLASGFGVETAMTIDAARLGLRILEVPVPLEHRATGRDFSGFRHRGRQGWDILRAVTVRAAGIR
jgi:hypothetical protein